MMKSVTINNNEYHAYPISDIVIIIIIIILIIMVPIVVIINFSFTHWIHPRRL